jgi:hypothetical protein
MVEQFNLRNYLYLLIYLLTYLLTHSTVQGIILKADSHSDCQKISFLYGIRRFITVFTKVRHRTLSWAGRILFAPIDPYLPKIQLNVILPLTPRSSHWSLTCINCVIGKRDFLKKKKKKKKEAVCVKTDSRSISSAPTYKRRTSALLSRRKLHKIQTAIPSAQK